MLLVTLFPFFQRFKQIRHRVRLDFLTSHSVEDIEQEDHQDNHGNDGDDHGIELQSILIEQGGTCLQLSVLSRLLLQVEIDVTIVVALLLVIESRINHTKALMDGSH